MTLVFFVIYWVGLTTSKARLFKGGFGRIVNNDPTGITSNSIKDSSADEYVNVYGINGVLIKQNVKREYATDNLENGQYIVGNKVVIVNK